MNHPHSGSESFLLHCSKNESAVEHFNTFDNHISLSIIYAGGFSPVRVPLQEVICVSRIVFTSLQFTFAKREKFIGGFLCLKLCCLYCRLYGMFRLGTDVQKRVPVRRSRVVISRRKLLFIVQISWSIS